MIETMMVIQTVVFTVTLLVLIAQTRQLRKAIHGSNHARMIEMLKDLRVLRINDPALAKVYSKDVEGLSDEETRYHFFNLTVLSIMEMIYVDWKQGLITKKVWDYWLNAIRKIAREESFRKMVKRDSCKIVNPEFFNIVEDIVRHEEDEAELDT